MESPSERVCALTAELRAAEARCDTVRARELRAELARLGMRARPPARRSEQRVSSPGEAR
jgi:hypothetical protein